MQQEAKYIGDELEVIGQLILAQYEGLPEYMLHWPPPFPNGHSLFTLGLEAITIIEECILLPISGTTFSEPPCSMKTGLETVVHLRAGYEQWFREVHRLLDILPESLLDCYVECTMRSTFKRKADIEHPVPLRICLLHALTQISMLAGNMQMLRQLFIDGERVLAEFTRQA